MLGHSRTLDFATSSPAQIQAFRVGEGAVIGQAYLGLAVIMTIIAGLLWKWRSALDHTRAEVVKTEGTLALFTGNPRVRFAALCIFAYVGAEVAIGSNMIAYLSDGRVMGLSPLDAGRLLAYYWGGAMVGRLIGGFVLRLFDPGKVLAAAATIAITLIAISAFSAGAVSGWALILVGLFNSLMFPTIFSLGTEGQGEEAPKISGILCTAIVGGALVPPLFGLLADFSGNIRVALWVPVICYSMIVAFGLSARRRA